MVNAHDVASFILKEHGEMTAMKLQKLVYYSQAWSLVWDERPLFRERIEAWANGPVVPALYREHKGMFKVAAWPKGDTGALRPEQRATVKAVLDFYGKRPAQWLSDLTHAENPWKDARRGLGPGDRGSAVISHASMAEYYGSL